MPSVGRSVDRIIGGLTHLLHLRAAQQNTVDDLAPYLDATRTVLFPAPVAPRDLTRQRDWVPRAAGRVADTLRWHSQHVPLCPHYRARHAGEYVRNQTVTARWIPPAIGPAQEGARLRARLARARALDRGGGPSAAPLRRAGGRRAPRPAPLPRQPQPQERALPRRVLLERGPGALHRGHPAVGDRRADPHRVAPGPGLHRGRRDRDQPRRVDHDAAGVRRADARLHRPNREPPAARRGRRGGARSSGG